MAVNFTVTVEGEEQLKRAFVHVIGSINDFRPYWKPLQNALFGISREQLESEGAKGLTGKYANLSTAYAIYKRKLFGDKRILERTDRLYDSLTSQNSDSIAEFGKTEAVFGTKVPYAKKHQAGARNLPKRPPYALSERQKRKMGGTLIKSLLAYVKRSGLKVDELGIGING